VTIQVGTRVMLGEVTPDGATLLKFGMVILVARGSRVRVKWFRATLTPPGGRRQAHPLAKNEKRQYTQAHRLTVISGPPTEDLS
jgi:hypothetical protein